MATANKILIQIRADAARVIKQAQDLFTRRSFQENTHAKANIRHVELEANTMLSSFAEQAIRLRLNQKNDEGRYGFYNPDVCSIEDLKTMLETALSKGNMLDAAIFCLFIYTRQQGERV
ncbi:hypothetical protein [Vibrio phage vB_VhaS-a]|nr:hypothetical protein [Vibrio phage vB_VhaS-a]